MFPLVNQHHQDQEREWYWKHIPPPTSSLVFVLHVVSCPPLESRPSITILLSLSRCSLVFSSFPFCSSWCQFLSPVSFPVSHQRRKWSGKDLLWDTGCIKLSLRIDFLINDCYLFHVTQRERYSLFFPFSVSEMKWEKKEGWRLNLKYSCGSRGRYNMKGRTRWQNQSSACDS